MRHFLLGVVFLFVLLPLPAQTAQIVNVGGGCWPAVPPPGSPNPPSLSISYTTSGSAWGEALWATCAATHAIGGPGVGYGFVLLGATDPATALPNCGCVLHSSCEGVYFVSQGPTGFVTWPIPPGMPSGLVLFVQSASIYLGPLPTPPTCDGPGFGYHLTDGFRVQLP